MAIFSFINPSPTAFYLTYNICLRKVAPNLNFFAIIISYSLQNFITCVEVNLIMLHPKNILFSKYAIKYKYTRYGYSSILFSFSIASIIFVSITSYYTSHFIFGLTYTPSILIFSFVWSYLIFLWLMYIVVGIFLISSRLLILFHCQL